MAKAKQKDSLGKRFLKWWLPWRGDSFGEVVRKLIFLIAVAVFIGAAAYLGDYFWQRYQSQQISNQVTEIYNLPVQDQTPIPLPEGYQQKFANLYAINEETAGWISVPDTTVNYPVLQAENNDYYLKRNIFKKYDINGVPFLDYRNELTPQSQSDNMVIYGHHMNFDGVFGVLVHYNNLDFYRQHPTVTFDTVYRDMKWKVVAGCYVATHSEDEQDKKLFDYQNYIDLSNKSRYNDFISQIKNRSVINTGVDVQYGDKFITLSTCANEFRDGRFIVVARLVRDGEEQTPDVSKASYNPSTLYPAVWHP